MALKTQPAIKAYYHSGNIGHGEFPHPTEDMHVWGYTKAGDLIAFVADGVTTCRVHEKDIPLYEGFTGGQYAVKILEETIGLHLSSGYNNDASDIIEKATTVLSDDLFAVHHIDVEQVAPALLPSCTFAGVFVDDQHIQLVQGGDCWIIIAFSDGEVFATKNQAYRYECSVREHYKTCKARYGDDWKKYFVPLLHKEQNRCANHQYGLLNGQLDVFVAMYSRIFLAPRLCSLILIGTDGARDFTQTAPENSQQLAFDMVQTYQEKRIVDVHQEFSPKGIFYVKFLSVDKHVAV